MKVDLLDDDEEDTLAEDRILTIGEDEDEPLEEFLDDDDGHISRKTQTMFPWLIVRG